ncbi:maltose transport system permease protein MalF [Candidatus Phycosocius bacilliformis]|uniref:Maltose transport system permease protein MalF n=1 Tax=Candidatus Phycosocius bacilliformis TaxID=1445552 RepID=A0A2P2ED75_9PROT|nr:sugar ABC transporter permease [Candidatus Phycosocius bacilliformis]GBF59016.1 maltose transport system permease protein MalF [Candidatus Phycosocius bacilliformis]
MKQNLTAIVSAMLLLVCGALVFLSQASQHRQALSAGMAAKAIAVELAGLTSVALTDGQTDQALASLLSDSLARADQQTDRYRLVLRDGKRLVHSNWPEEIAGGQSGRPLKISEKPLYDLILSVPTEGVSLTMTPEGARAAAPVIVDGQRVGVVEIVKPLGPTGPPLIALWQWGLLGLVTVVACALAVRLQALGPWISLVLPLAAGLALGQLAQAGLAGDAPVLISQMNQELNILGEAVRAVAANQGLLMAGSPPPFKPELMSAVMDAAGLGHSMLLTGVLGALLGAFIGFGAANASWKAIAENPTAYAYVAPALIGMLLLAFFPFFYGVVLSFTDTTLLNQGASWADRWVGFANYASILIDFNFGGGGNAFNYQNFYWTLGVTIVWTISNVVLGVSIGLAMALLLNIKGLRGVAIYRTLLILPWAIPNYITALTWKGMFHPQFGAINQAIQAFGGQPVQWFDNVVPSFMTGLATNAWLSFPFMMVVALGALQAVDEDMYEAARIDGASPWQQFWYITLPSLRPALLPAIIVSVVWTFNMFNVIYLVSAGQPSGANEILVTRAYRIAFEEYRYGYAAAYSVVIFLILLVYGVFQIRATSATEANNK